MKKAIIYARQSSGSESSSESIDTQIANCMNLAKKMNIEVIDIFFDYNVSGKTYPAGYEVIANQDQAFLNWIDTQTGYKKFRNGLKDLLDRITKANFLIVDEITRLYRPLSNSFLESFINQKLISNNVQILQVKGGRIDLSIFDQHLITMLKNQINDEQIAKQRQKSIEVMAKIRDSGFLPTGPKAWGLDYDKKTKKISMSAEKAEVVLFIFESLLKNIPYNQIICAVNQNYSGFFKKIFWSSSFYNIAQNPIYCGYQFNSSGELIKNKQWDGIISYENFENVQKIMQKKRLLENKKHKILRKNHFLPLSGYLFCGNCGCRLVSGINRNNVYYRCPNTYRSENLLCRQSRIAESFEYRFAFGLKEAVYKYFNFFLECELEADKQKKSVVCEKNINEKLVEIKHEQNFFANSFISGALPLSEYRKYSKNLNKKIRNLQNYENTTEEKSHFVKDLYQRYLQKKISNEEYFYLLKNTLNKIVVYQDKVIFDTRFGIFEHRRKISKRRNVLSRR